MYIGLLGGTFNPIHFGHLRTAVEVLESFRMKEIVFIPSAIPPHKDSKDIADPIDRLKMVNLAITGNPNFSVSEIEIHRRGKSYTIDTIRQIKEQRPEDQLAFVMGFDAFLEINTWHKYQELFSECDFIVHSRPGAGKVGLGQAIPEGVRELFKKKGNPREWEHASGRKLFFIEVTQLDISSTAIRAMAREGRSVRYLMPRRATEYLYEHGLYK